MTKRIFLFDHVCALPYGHNLNAIVIFKKALEKFYGQVMCFATLKLPGDCEQSEHVIRELYYPYEGFMPSKKNGKFFSVISRIFRKYGLATINKITGKDIVQRRCINNYKKLFKKYKITGSDIIFFPSADYYGVNSLICFLSKLNFADRPRIHVRLIGVMEGCAYNFGSGRPELFRAMRKYAVTNKITFSAETPVLTDYAKLILKGDVFYFPYPLVSEYVKKPITQVKTISNPGQGRADKGFFRLLRIYSELNVSSPGKFRFIIQPMGINAPFYRKRYQSQIFGITNAIVMPERLSQLQIDKIYAESDCIILPYDAGTYQYRGSAVFQESIAFGKLVVVSEGIGIVDLVARYGNGLIANDDESFVNCITKIIQMSEEELDLTAKTARELYKKDFNVAMSMLVGGIE